MRAAATILDEHDGRLIRIRDRAGSVWAELAWAGNELELTVPGAIVGAVTLEHPVLGAVHPISATGSPVARTVMTTVDWSRPTRIPAIAAPGTLPAGSGGAILNVLAVLAERAGVAALRYAGPYPTSALYRALLRSFRTVASEDAFTADALERALRGANDELAFAFCPAPHARVAIPGGHVELRDSLERAVIGGICYERAETAHARLVPVAIGWAAEIWFGDAVYARIATFAGDGALIDGPHAIPHSSSDVIGRDFPPPLRAAIAELVADAVPAPLATAARDLVTTSTLRWADLGGRVAHHDGEGFAVHAALWDRIAPFGLARVALAITEALVPVVIQTTVARVMSA